MIERRNIAPYFLLFVMVLLAVASFRIAQVFLNYLLLALFLGFLSYPWFIALRDKLKSRRAAAFITATTVTAIVVVPLTILTIRLVSELSNIIQGLAVSNVRAEFNALAASLYSYFGAEYSSESAAGDDLLALLVPSINDVFERAASTLIGTFAEGVVGTFVLVYVLYYSYKDGPKGIALLRDVLPMRRMHTDQLFDEVGTMLKAVFFGNVLTSLIQAIIAGFGYYLFGVPNVVFWSALTFVLALLPVIGTPIIWFPWGMVLMLQGETFNGIALLIYGAIMVSTLDNFIRPKLIGDRAHVHPVLILVGVLGGVVVFGFSGFILGPLTLATFFSIVQLYRREFSSPQEQPLPVEMEE